MNSPNFYDIFGVSRNASTEDIRVAYHRLAQEYHPDKHVNDPNASFFATEFRHIHEIYEVLSNPDQRRKYDEHLKAVEATQQPPVSPPPIRNSTPAYSAPKAPSSFATKPPEAPTPIKPTKGRYSGRVIGVLIMFFMIGLLFVLGTWLNPSNPVQNNSSTSPSAQGNPNPLPPPPMTQTTSGDVFKSKIDPFADWERLSLSTGQEPPFCANIQPDYTDSLDNYLKVTVMNNEYDVIIKLVNAWTHRCVRAVYIKAGDSYLIKNIPEGAYYVKEAYGNDFRKTTQNGQCQLRFVSNARYKKLNKTLDYNLENYEDSAYIHTRVPSYELEVGIMSSIENDSDRVEGNTESEDEFDQ